MSKASLNLPFLPRLISCPALASHLDIPPLPFLRSTTDQNHETPAILAEIDPQPWTEVDPVFIDAGTNTFNIREVALLKARQRYRHFGGGVIIKGGKPSSNGLSPSSSM